MNISLEKLIEMKVLRESMFGSGDWYVIYTEDGPKDVSLAELTEDAKCDRGDCVSCYPEPEPLHPDDL